MRRGLLRAVLVLIFVELLSFGLFAPWLGFYHDDWSVIERVAHCRSYWEMVLAYARSDAFWSRPLEILQYALFMRIGGQNPLIHQLMLLGLDAAQGILFYVLLSRLTGSRPFALAAASLALMYPNRSVTHIWFVNSPQGVAIVLALAGLLAYQEWLETRRTRWFAAGLALYLLGLLSYDTVAFLPLLLGGGLFVKSLQAGRPARKAAWTTLRDFLPFAGALAADVLWQWTLLPLAVGRPNQKSLGFSLTHALQALGAGFECVTNRVLDICARSLPIFLLEAGLGLILLWAACTAAAAALLSARQEQVPRRGLFVALAAAGAGWLGAYIPFAMSADYMPQIYGIMSRTNGVGALVGGLLLAAGLFALGPRSRTAGLVLAIGAFTWTNWAGSLEWVRSWGVQQRILGRMQDLAPGLPPSSTVLLTGTPAHYGRAVIFDSHDDFDSAIRLATGRDDLHGNIVTARFRFEPEAAVEYLNGKVWGRYPYERLYLYRVDRDVLEPLQGPPRG